MTTKHPRRKPSPPLAIRWGLVPWAVPPGADPTLAVWAPTRAVARLKLAGILGTFLAARCKLKRLDCPLPSKRVAA